MSGPSTGDLSISNTPIKPPSSSPPNGNPDERPPNPHSKTIFQKWFPTIDRELANMMGPSLTDGSIHVLGGAVKAFAMYWIPVTLLKRRLHGNFQRALAFAVFVGGVRLVDRFIRLHFRKPEHGGTGTIETSIRKYHMGIAGGISAGVALTIDPTIYKSTIILFWCIIRTLRCFVPAVPYGSTIIMCLTASHILSVWINHPDELDPTYFKFLTIHGGRSKEQMAEFLKGPTNPCYAMHPGKTCVEDKLEFFPTSFLRSVKLYLPVYLVMLLFSKSRNPKYFIQNILRSSLFLSSYCTIAWISACTYYKFRGPVNRLNMMQHTWVSGLPVLFEREGRRNELAAYCLTYAADSIYRMLVKKKLVKKSPFLHWLAMSICSAVMLHNHKEQPAILMKWLFKLGAGAPPAVLATV